MKNLYVDTDTGNNGDNGTTWELAKATLAGAIAALPGDLTADDSYAIHCKGTAADTSAVLINNHETDATHYIVIQTDVDDRHSGIWTTSKYRLTVTNDVGIYDLVNYVFIDGLQISVSSPTANYKNIIQFEVGATNQCRVSNCILKGSGNADYIGNGISIEANGNVDIWNNIIYSVGTGNGSNVISCNGNVVNIYNCTLISGYIGIRCAAGTATVKNTYAGGSGGQDFYRGGGTFAKINCASEDQSADDTGASETATNCVAGAVALSTDTFVNVSAGSEDFHLAAGTGSALYDAGDAPGGSAPLDYTTDIDGETVSIWCIGADSRAAAAPPTTKPSMTMMGMGQ